MFELIMEDRDGKQHSLFYDPHTSTVTDKDGNSAVTESTPQQYNPIHLVSPDTPGRKGGAFKRVKIQVGLSCNYSCSYCLQRSEVELGAKTSTRDAKMFMFHMDKWLQEPPEKFEFWGGEPLLYWAKIKVLIEGLREKYPDARMSIISNGSLLSDDIIDTLKEYKVAFYVSHDGPGQSLRGPDPLEDKEQFRLIRKAMIELAPYSGIISVLSPISYDPAIIVERHRRVLDIPDLNVSFEGPVITYDGGMNFEPEQYQDMMQKVAFYCMGEPSTLSPTFQHKMYRFLMSLKNARPSDFLGQKCAMDMPDQIAVDLLGNVMTCQNTGAMGKHKIGHVFDMKNVALTTSKHWKYREECSSCPVLQLCQGSCMYLEGQNWYHSCNAEYYYNMGILAGALFHSTGSVLREVKGDILRPDPADYGLA